MSVVLPYRIGYRILHNTRFMSMIEAKPQGGFGLFYTNQYAQDLSRKATFFRSRAFSLGYQLLAGITRNWQIRLGASILMGRKIWISDQQRGAFKSQENFYSGSVKNGMMLELGIRYSFAKRKTKSNPVKFGITTEPELPLNDEDLKNIDPDDLTDPDQSEDNL